MVKLFLTKADYDHTTFVRPGVWASKNVRSNMRCVYLSAAPPGPHDLSDCDAFCVQWTSVCVDVMKALSAGRVCLVWAYGPLIRGCLPFVIFGMFEGSDSLRYHIEGATLLETPGFIYSWVSFEFDPVAFHEIIKENVAGLGDFTWLWGLVTDDPKVPKLLPRAYEDIGAEEVGRSGAIAFSFSTHFEGVYLLADETLMAAALARIRGLENVKVVEV